jgi:hypothetical protein
MADFRPENAPKFLDMNTFLSFADIRGGFAKSCRFGVQILPGPALIANPRRHVFQELLYLCEATEYPGRSLNSVDVRYYGPNIKLPFQTVYEDLNMTFLCRTESLERQIFDDWLEIINPTNSYDFNYRDIYSAKIHLYQFSEAAQTWDDYEGGAPTAQYSFTLHDAYPVIVNPQPVTWADDGIQRLTVTFTYFKWTREDWDKEPKNREFSPLVIT